MLSQPLILRSILVFSVLLLPYIGGCTQFKDFGRRLERDVKRLVDTRVAQSELDSGGRHKAKEVCDVPG